MPIFYTPVYETVIYSALKSYHKIHQKNSKIMNSNMHWLQNTFGRSVQKYN